MNDVNWIRNVAKEVANTRRKGICGFSRCAYPRDKSYLMYSSRIGLGDTDPHYQQLPLRAAIGKLSTPFAFKEKTQLLNNYLAERKLRGDAAKLLAKEMRQ